MVDRRGKEIVCLALVKQKFNQYYMFCSAVLNADRQKKPPQKGRQTTTANMILEFDSAGDQNTIQFLGLMDYVFYVANKCSLTLQTVNVLTHYKQRYRLVE